MRLLIVDDDGRSRRALSDLLVQLGHTTVVAASAKEGLDRLEGEPFDLVFAELRTRRSDGMKLLRTVRRRWPETHVVVLAGSSDVDEAVKSMGVRTIDSAREPIDRDRVHAVLERVEGELALSEGSREPTTVPVAHRAPGGPAPPRSMTLAAHELGEGRLEPALLEGRIQKVLRIDATGAPSNLLARLLVGSYITGQDQVLVTARNGLTAAQRNEIHRLVDRILGMTVVGDTPEMVEVQNFIDPGKYELPRLLHRVVQMLRTELEACGAALSGREAPQLQLIETIEEEIDRFYLLMVRQLLLSSDSPRIARNIDVESHHYQIGYRLVAKVLEVTGDLIHGIGTELQENLPGLRRLPRTMIRELVTRVERLELLLTRTMDAFDRLSVVEANATLNVIGEALPKDAGFGQLICRRIPNRKVAVAAQRIAYNLDMALEMLIIVNEVTINRSVEPETVARTGTRVPMGPRGSRLSSKASHRGITEPAIATRRRARSGT
ncbi:MAG TPA: response regulator [Thermoplasmata archaeon]